jgi:hypothetical protein
MKTQINTTTNNVIVQNINRTLTIVDHNCNNINVTQPLVNVIEVVSPGPQGLQGLQGDSIFIYIEDETYSTTSSIQITGSLAVSQPITGSLYGTSSWALSASWAPFPDIDTGSLVTTSSFNSFTSSYNTGSFTGSFTGDGSDLQNIPASSIIGLNLSQIISGSVSASISPENGLQVNTQIVAPSFTGSLLGTASYSTQALSSSYSQTASYSDFSPTVYTIGARIYTENLYIENGSKGYRHIGSNGDIVKVITLANTNGNINMEIRRNGTILGTSSLFNQSSSIDSTLSGWTTNLNTDDLIEFYVPSSSIYINDFSIFIDIKTKQ